MSILNLDPNHKNYFFEWLAEERLNKYCYGVPRTGVFHQENGYPDIKYYTEEEFMQLIIQTEKNYPEFSYEDEIIKFTSLVDLDDFRQGKL